MDVPNVYQFVSLVQTADDTLRIVISSPFEYDIQRGSTYGLAR